METHLGQPNFLSISFFFIFVALTLVITYWAARKTKTSSEFYAAGRSITGFQNGLALSGDFMSAASFLGISGMVALKGYDGMLYAVGWLVGWPALMFLIAEPLRNLGKFTFADVVAFRLKQKPIRIAAAVGGILVTLTYSIAQIVGSGKLINLMFGLPYEAAVVLVGIVMLLYVLFGGMIATTWVQIIKACLLLFGVTLLTLLALSKFGFSLENLYGAVEQKFGKTSLEPGGLVANPLDAVSLGLALMLGLLGLPHILMRFYTVPDAKEARKSVAYATSFIGYFYLIIPIVGFAAAVLIGREPIASIDKGGNMAAALLAELLGGTLLMGFIAAVAFATILAVVAGLTLAAASTISHDIYVSVVKGGEATEEEQVKVARRATVAFGVLSILFGILFKDQNVAFLVGLAFAVAASGNFPALFLSIVWKNFSTIGGVVSILTGSISAIVLIILSPTVWVDLFGFEKAIFPLKNPAVVSMSLSFAVAYLFSKFFPETRAQELYEKEKIRTYLGVGAE
ncbi:cation acetate symporter [Leptospira kmetyi]|uniref:Cation/acetate symporter ActP n=1 Tax=Leptospira kmetyi TaxID=408139 RepID=A0A2M9XWP2_9LEPT|nr:sodium/solute symporter [Leptospira kmetyi]AYV56797.1 cation/acetate symporter ActP [Leptospira kmetyi]EQA51788.1 cation/acetate symporter ActP [Leptospira kmetyi serovar Malaysia str. Bejo-Iso9]PJZ43533.1 cation acetate symporter [Leptospira kmetyi]TGK18366.1 cation/acetate symporter ActP [Leptospira kmetyi]TGK26747.1 cation/acetate symporter ActP [Leptospira kmetyi]